MKMLPRMVERPVIILLDVYTVSLTANVIVAMSL